ncbi:MAG: aldo/keto reductase [Anaerolineae bacterium]|nr:aldo/keto reductase [Anaerolineae bacterium]
MELRRLGRSGIKVSPLGLGTARIAGLGWRDESAPQAFAQAKWDASGQSAAVRQIQAAVDLGVTLFDTADNYGQGLSECILGEALGGRRDGIVVVTKFGEDPMPDQEDPWALDADSVKRKCEASLRRLGVECIDLYLLHRRDYPLEQAPALMEVLEDLVYAGKICYYGWSTDDVERAGLFAHGEHCIAIEHRLNVFNDNAAMLDLCREQDLASLNRVPLLMGVLTGRWSSETKLKEDDPRAQWFEHEGFLKVLACAQQLEPYLTSDGRSYVQGALGWIWARSPLAIPLPGFRTMEQMQGLVQAQQFGPLPSDVMRVIAEQVKSAGFANQEGGK